MEITTTLHHWKYGKEVGWQQALSSSKAVLNFNSPSGSEGCWQSLEFQVSSQSVVLMDNNQGVVAAAKNPITHLMHISIYYHYVHETHLDGSTIIYLHYEVGWCNHCLKQMWKAEMWAWTHSCRSCKQVNLLYLASDVNPIVNKILSFQG